MTAECADLGQFSDAAMAERSDKSRKEVAAALGLPENTSWPKINKINMEKRRRKEELQKSPALKETPGFIEERRQQNEAKRKEMAVKYGLTESATWPQINQAISEKIKDKKGPSK